MVIPLGQSGLEHNETLRNVGLHWCRNQNLNIAHIQGFSEHHLEIQIAVVLNTLFFVGVKKGVEKKRGKRLSPWTITLTEPEKRGKLKTEGQIENKREKNYREEKKINYIKT